jgi:hypothetical protein
VIVDARADVRRRPIALAAVLIAAALLFCGSTRSFAATDAPAVKTSTTAEGTIYQLETAGCSASLLRRPDHPALLYRADCRQDLAMRTAAFARLVAAALPTPFAREEGATVLVPGLEATFPDFARRLAYAAARSPEWYGERAKRDPRFGNRLVVKIATTAPVYRELQEALRPLDLKIRLAEVENIRVAMPAATPFADWLADRGVSGREQVPYDADALFRVWE